MQKVRVVRVSAQPPGTKVAHRTSIFSWEEKEEGGDRTLDTKYGICRLWHWRGTPPIQERVLIQLLKFVTMNECIQPENLWRKKSYLIDLSTCHWVIINTLLVKISGLNLNFLNFFFVSNGLFRTTLLKLHPLRSYRKNLEKYILRSPSHFQGEMGHDPNNPLVSWKLWELNKYTASS